MTTRLLWPSAVEHDAQWMSAVLQRALPAGVTWWPMDNRYWLPTQHEFDVLLAWDPTDLWEYLTDRFDCESYAFQLQATFVSRLGMNCVGVILDHSSVDTTGRPTPHAYNLVVFSEGSYRYLEPQEDKFVELGAGLYTLTSGVLLL